MAVELHGAFAWDCENCGSQNFERAIQGVLSKEVVDALSSGAEPIIVPYGAASESEIDEESDSFVAAALVNHVLMAPKRVTCKKCGESFNSEVELYEGEDGGDYGLDDDECKGN